MFSGTRAHLLLMLVLLRWVKISSDVPAQNWVKNDRAYALTTHPDSEPGPNSTKHKNGLERADFGSYLPRFPPKTKYKTTVGMFRGLQFAVSMACHPVDMEFPQS